MTRMEISPYTLSPTFVDDPEERIVCSLCGDLIWSDRESDPMLPIPTYVSIKDDEQQEGDAHEACAAKTPEVTVMVKHIDSSKTDSGAGTNPEHPAWEARWMPDDKPETTDWDDEECALGCGERLGEAEWAEFVKDGEIVMAHGECAVPRGLERA